MARRKANGTAPTLPDAMLCVLAIAIGLALHREFDISYGSADVFRWDNRDSVARNVLHYLMHWSHLVFFMTWSASAALLLARFTHAGCSIRRVVTEPGTLACWTSTMVGVAAFVPMLLSYAASAIGFASYDSARPEVLRQEIALIDCLGYTVAAAWLTLALSRRWRADSSWINRAGVFLGTITIALCAVRNLW
jgi:hypothetical protein